MAFMISVLIKNIAVALIVPISYYIGCLILTQIMRYSVPLFWLANSPFPYVNMSMIYGMQNEIYYSAAPTFNMGLGVGLLLGLAAGFIGLALLIFRKQDITH